MTVTPTVNVVRDELRIHVGVERKVTSEAADNNFAATLRELANVPLKLTKLPSEFRDAWTSNKRL